MSVCNRQGVRYNRHIWGEDQTCSACGQPSQFRMWELEQEHEHAQTMEAESAVVSDGLLSTEAPNRGNTDTSSVDTTSNSANAD